MQVGLVHLTLTEPLIGSPSSGEHDSQAWKPQEGGEAWGGLHL